MFNKKTMQKISDKIKDLRERYNEAVNEYDQAILNQSLPSKKTMIFSKIKRLHAEIKDLEKIKIAESRNKN